VQELPAQWVQQALRTLQRNVQVLRASDMRRLRQVLRRQPGLGSSEAVQQGWRHLRQAWLLVHSQQR
jgi:hypothetical protein